MSMYTKCTICGRDEKYAVIKDGEWFDCCKPNCHNRGRLEAIVNTPRCHICHKAPEDCECPPIWQATINIPPAMQLTPEDIMRSDIEELKRQVAELMKGQQLGKYIEEPCMFDGMPQGTVTGLVCTCKKCSPSC